VVGISADGQLRVKFSKGTWLFTKEQLVTAEAWPAAVRTCTTFAHKHLLSNSCFRLRREVLAHTLGLNLFFARSFNRVFFICMLPCVQEVAAMLAANAAARLAHPTGAVG
jgi:hypothetical protein